MKTITIGITAADFAGNKGAAAMLQTIIKNVMREKDNVEFKLFQFIHMKIEFRIHMKT